MLKELSKMEQRYQAVLAMQVDGPDGDRGPRRSSASVVRPCMSGCAAMRPEGLDALADRSHRPASCPHQMDAALEAMVCELAPHEALLGPGAASPTSFGRQGVDPVPRPLGSGGRWCAIA